VPNIIYSKEHHHIIKRLKIARIESGLTQEASAKKLGRSQSFISKLESGQRKIDIITLKRLARLYKKNITFFLGGK